MHNLGFFAVTMALVSAMVAYALAAWLRKR